MKKRALMLASVASMIDQFNIPNISLLQSLGYEVDVIADFVDGGSISSERIISLKKRLSDMNVTVFHIAIPRSITRIGDLIESYKRIRSTIVEREYSLIHCHSPIGGVLCRLAAKDVRKSGAKVLYTAHGFHFYKGAPLMNWLFFYPIEKICSKYTDVLITINKEDYNFAKKHMRSRLIEYVPGIGVDTKAFAFSKSIREKKRLEYGLKDDDIALLSVGELNKNKNHETALKAISQIEDRSRIHYFIVGKGDLNDYLSEMAISLNVNLHLLGYQTCMHELYCMADIFLFPSFREGLPVSLMEAMASGLPCIVSKIRGNSDLIQDGKGGFLFDPKDDSCFSKILKSLCRDNPRDIGSTNTEIVKKFDKSNVNDKMRIIYKSV